jgi:aminodeoxychorismate lyase
VLAYVNGQYIPSDRPALPVNDRSFMYGDGLFETIRITNGQPFLWHEHLDRLRRGAEFLKIPIPAAFTEIEEATRHLLAQNDTPEGMVRIHLSRGAGERGYGLPKTPQPTLVITTHKALHAAPRGLNVITSTIRVLADDALAHYKTANRLPNILARLQADDAGGDEALLLNNRGEIAEATAANVFVLRSRELITPPLASGALAGTTRAFILKIAPQFGIAAIEAPLTVEDLLKSDGVYLTSAHWLIAPVVSLDGTALRSSLSSIQSLRKECERAALGI